MTGRLWGYGLLALGVASVAALMALNEASATSIFTTIFLLAALYGLVAEAGLRTRRLNAPSGLTGGPDLPAGFGRALLEQMPAPLLVLDQKGRVSYANPAAFALIPRLQAGLHFSNLFRAPLFIDAVTDTIATGQTHRVEFAAGTGLSRYYAAQVGPIPPGSDLGQDVQAIVLLEDRSEAQRLEALRSDFIANASHELRTPLASVSGFIETLQGHARDDPEARDKFLAVMKAQTERMQRLVTDMMSLSRIEMSEHQRPQDLIFPGQLALETIAALAPIAERQGVTLAAGDIDTTARVPGDRDQINQVLTNLIDNAIKYGGKGASVQVFTAAPDPHRTRMTGISVADTGPGIAREHLPRLTERFYRVNARLSRESGGTGLGLAIVKHILNRHGGELAIESVPDEGSRFTFWLPVAQD